MGGKTTNFNWDYGVRAQVPWWDTWATIFQSIDTELYNLKHGTTVHDDIKTKGPWVDVRAFMDGLSGRPTYAAWYADMDNTDATPAIEAAINSVHYGIVFLPGGSYKITSTLNIIDPIHLVGAGKSATILNYSGAGSVITVSASASSYNSIGGLKISSMTLNCNGVVGITLEATGAYVIAHSIIEDLYINNVSHGIYLSAGVSFKNKIRDIRITGVSGKGIYLTSGSYLNFDNIEISGTGNDYAIYDAGGSNSFSNITCDGCIYTQGTSYWDNIIIEGIYGSTPPAVGAFTSVTGAVVINRLEILDVPDAKCSYGIDIYSKGNIINGLKSFTSGVGFPTHLLGFETNSGGVINDATAYPGSLLVESYTPVSILSGWNILGGTNISAGSQILGGLKSTYGIAAPIAGTWAVGDRCWNTAPSVGQPIGWICTVAGSPGTWTAMPNL